ncbi:hypothetical protein FGO68_gene16187 [Halteria grandinella]|uniref:Poly(A) RNA polymerase mitochondrial-like central palm domain-containing protein n=1 Tax=Halteria grandinella TaxID=5974 RepID=A0A8J8NUN0_HALGN|nr:hypothetical protein FGO68_gene16187 [Halteria grandinella]
MSADWAGKYDIKVLFYGSAVNGLLTCGASDVDLVVLLCDRNTGELVYQDHKDVLELIKKQVFKCFPGNHGSRRLIIPNGVLALKRLYVLQMEDTVTKLKIDLCVNNLLGIVNSEFLATYCKLDTRYHSACRILKRIHTIYSPYKYQPYSKLTNYCLNMMLLVFFQERGILPNILRPTSESGWLEIEQQYKVNKSFYQGSLKQRVGGAGDSRYAQKSNAQQRQVGETLRVTFLTNINRLSYQEAVEEYQTPMTYDHHTTTAELLLDFLTFMTNDKFLDIHCFDVPNGKMTLKSQISRKILGMTTDPDNRPDLHPYYVIDPFDLNHNPGKSVKYKEVRLLPQQKKYFSMIKSYRVFFQRMVEKIKDGKLLLQLVSELSKGDE